MCKKPANDFSEALESIRERRGLTRAEFAEEIRYDRPGYYSIIGGRSMPGTKFMEGALSLKSLSEEERRQLLKTFLQLQLERMGASDLRVSLRPAKAKL